jgi:hypothetical protein
MSKEEGILGFGSPLVPPPAHRHHLTSSSVMARGVLGSFGILLEANSMVAGTHLALLSPCCRSFRSKLTHGLN